MNIFEDLTLFGFQDLDTMDIYPKEEPIIEKTNLVPDELSIQQALYDKSFECPICGKKFKSKAIKSGKNRLVKIDIDLKPYYLPANPILYGVIHCNCGYTSVEKNFSRVTSSQRIWITNSICNQFQPKEMDEYRDIEDGIRLYKLALLNTIVKKGKTGERAYICLKLGWLYRDLGDKTNELAFLQYAVDGLSVAISSERFPLFEFDENTSLFIIASLYFQLGKPEQTLKWLSPLIFSNNVPIKLKDRAIDLKEKVKNSKKAYNPQP